MILLHILAPELFKEAHRVLLPRRSTVTCALPEMSSWGGAPGS